jgi:hypothetical protein
MIQFDDIYSISYEHHRGDCWKVATREESRFDGAAWSVHSDYFMRFTGFRDNNGGEIYEKDLLQTYFGLNKVIEVMEWDDFGRWSVINTFKGFEVIGNIYEHPHLLQESEHEQRN